ncbi:MAG: DUF4386 domain-containing protein [Anaerolineae bacterium]|nr:DUF4386 domain-containing protein [Anaerolineae bacterium]
MNANKRTASMMGILYIVGTVSGILSRVLTDPIQGAPDMLRIVSANGERIIAGTLFVLAMGVVLTLIPIVAFPVLRKHDEVLALGYVVFRGALEGSVYLAIAVSWLLLLPLSQIYHTGGAEAVHFQALGHVLLETAELGAVLMITFGLGGVLFYYLLYRSRLVPRWLSAWGLMALLLNLAAGFLTMFGVFGPTATLSTVLQLPIFVQEMVLAIWLIAKGFTPAVCDAAFARPIPVIRKQQ